MKCPKCGTESAGKFCLECGEKLIVEEPVRDINIPAIKAHLFAEFFPCILFLLFTLSLFGFSAAQVAYVPETEVMGEITPRMGFGNLYRFARGEWRGIFPAFQGIGICGLVFAAMGCVFAAVLIFITFKKHLRYIRVNIFGINKFVPLYAVAEIFVFVFYIFFITFASVAIAKISGAGFEAGACPIGVLAVACVCTVLHLAARFAEGFIDKNMPEISVERRAERYYKGVSVDEAYAVYTPQPAEKPKSCALPCLIKYKRICIIFPALFFLFNLNVLGLFGGIFWIWYGVSYSNPLRKIDRDRAFRKKSLVIALIISILLIYFNLFYVIANIVFLVMNHKFKKRYTDDGEFEAEIEKFNAYMLNKNSKMILYAHFGVRYMNSLKFK